MLDKTIDTINLLLVKYLYVSDYYDLYDFFDVLVKSTRIIENP